MLPSVLLALCSSVTSGSAQVLRIKPRLAMYKAHAPPALLSLLFPRMIFVKMRNCICIGGKVAEIQQNGRK